MFEVRLFMFTDQHLPLFSLSEFCFAFTLFYFLSVPFRNAFRTLVIAFGYTLRNNGSVNVRDEVRSNLTQISDSWFQGMVVNCRDLERGSLKFGPITRHRSWKNGRNSGSLIFVSDWKREVHDTTGDFHGSNLVAILSDLIIIWRRITDLKEKFWFLCNGKIKILVSSY